LNEALTLQYGQHIMQKATLPL